MLLVRLLTTALCVTCVVLIATINPIHVVLSPAPAPQQQAAAPLPAAERVPPLSVVDVAAGLTPVQIAALIRLAPGEHVTAVNDRALDSDVEAGAVLDELPLLRGSFVDLTVATPRAERRVLLLLH